MKTKAEMMTKLVDMLATLSTMSYEKLFDEKEHEQPIIDMFEELYDQLRVARGELPRQDSTGWDIEHEFPMELMVTVKASICPEEPMTRHYPGAPAHVDDMEILIEGCGVTSTLFDKLTTMYERELDEQVWEAAEAKAEDMEVARAEHAMSAAEARRDSLEDR